MPNLNAASKTAPYLRRVLTRVVTQTDRLGLWIVAALLGDILVVGIVRAQYKPLWLDEIMGLLIAKLPVGADIWAICKSGADNQPPLYHYAMRASVRLLGNDALGMRVPSVIGYALFCLCLYWFVSRRTSRLYGLIAMLVPGLTHCWYYATEGRPYALILACAGLSAVCWQGVVMDRRRWLMLVGFGLSLACAINLHYYAVLLFLPFAIAETVRTYQRRKPDFPVWLALTAPLLILLVYVPVIRASKVNSGIPGAFFAKPAWYGSLLRFFGEFLGPSLIGLVSLGCIYLAVQFFWRPSTTELGRCPTANPRDLMPEASLVLSFTCIPVFAIALSKFGTHIFFTRYGIAGMFGFAALLGLGTWFAFLGRKGPALAVAAAFAALFLHNQIQHDLPEVRAERANPARVSIPHRIPALAQRDSLPIVATNLDDFMQLSYYGNSTLRKRLFYVSSEAFAKQYLGFTFHERMMIGAAPFFKTQVVAYSAFIKEHPSFYVFGSLEFSQWVVPKLIEDHAKLQLLQGGPADVYGDFADVFLLAQIPANS
ncbi:MAG: glycosyltransferase family 39 protein [Acidobacteriota bacterium]|nr:glycosyltransferase family 39 protein [Acidobacteriota bacterium]